MYIPKGINEFSTKDKNEKFFDDKASFLPGQTKRFFDRENEIGPSEGRNRISASINQLIFAHR
jgi:hypothetical protein